METCIKCEVRETRNERSFYCQECFDELLQQKLDEDEDNFSPVASGNQVEKL